MCTHEILCPVPEKTRCSMRNRRTLVLALTIASVIIGLFHLVLYFYNLIPGQIPTGAPFYLRMGIIFILGVPMILQLPWHLVRPTPKIINYLALAAVLGIAILAMILLLPSMMVGSSWGG